MQAFLRQLLSSDNSTQAMQAAVDSVCAITGCDVSWAGLSRGSYLVMGAQHGLNSSEIARVWRLSIGEGIDGRVAAERRVIVSRDYRYESRRVPMMKRLIDEEGIRATLTVPVLVGESTIGVLYAACRRVYDWTDREQEVVVEVAQDLAVRLAQLDELAEQRRAGERWQASQEALVQAVGRCTHLARSLNTHTEVTSAIDILAHDAEARVELRSEDGTVVHAAGAPADEGTKLLWRSRLGGLQQLDLVVLGAHDLDRATDAAIELYAAVIGLQLARANERTETLNRVMGSYFDQLFAGRIDDASSYLARASLVGINLSIPSYVVSIDRRHSSSSEQRVTLADIDLLRDHICSVFSGSTVIPRGGRFVAIIPSRDRSTRDLCKELERLLSPIARSGTTEWAAGVGRRCDDLIDFASSYDESRVALEMSLHSEATSSAVSAADLGVLGMASLSVAQLRTSVREQLGTLLESDATGRTQYIKTLRTFLNQDRGFEATAAVLHVHVNTVRYRMAKIESLLAADTRDVNDRYRLESALRALSVIDAMTRPESL